MSPIQAAQGASAATVAPKPGTFSIVFLEETVLRGPNVWTYRPVLEALVDIGDLENFPSNTLPGFADRLAAWLPGLIEHRCSPGVRGGFLQRLQQGTWSAHILEHVSLELLGQVGLATGFGRARETETVGVYRVIIRAQQEEVAKRALHTACDLVLAAMHDQAFNVAEAVESLRDLTESLCLGPSTAAIVDAADDRDIPAIRLNGGNLVQLGYGARQRRIWTAETDRTSAIAEGISRDKELTRRLLEQCGVPVPEGRTVSSPEDAWEAAQEIGLPVVVKPIDGNHGRGVFTHLSTREEVEAAWRIAVDEGSAVLVERFVLGNEHRLLVVGDRVVAAARGEPAVVTGDGSSTVRQLIELQLNTDPRRGSTEHHPLNRVGINSAAQLELARQGLDADAIPPAGQSVLIQRNGNVAFDVTDRVHPEVAQQVALAARIVGLDIAGIDLVAEDISRPLSEQGGAIVEVNAGPGLLMHLRPAAGKAQNVGRAIVDHVFKGEADGRIPIVGITGGQGRSAVAQTVARLLRTDGQRTGLACQDGVWLHERLIQSTPGATWAGGRRLLQNPGVDAAVIENGAAVILQEGLAYDRCQVGVVIDASGKELDHLGLVSADQRIRVLRTQIDVVLASGTAVLEAGDAIAMAMTELCDGEVILYSTDAGATAIQTHCAQGGRAVVSRDRLLVLLHGENEIVLGATDELQGGTLSATELLASAATGWALGISPAQLRGALKPATRPTATDLPQSSQNPTRSTAQLAALKRRVSSTTPEFTA
jgi:cyanophycin synthetase